MKRKIHAIVTNPLFSGSAIMVIGSNGVSFINYLYHLVMGRMLGPVGYGELAAIISLIGLLGIIPGSLNLVVIKHISAAQNEEDSAALISWLKTKIFLASLIFSFLVLLVSPFISSFLHIGVSYLILVSTTFLFGTLSMLNRSILQGLLRFKQMVISLLIENVIKLGVSILLVYLGFQVGGAIAGFVIAVILGWYITNRYLRYHSKRINIKIDFKQIFSFTIPVLVQAIALTSLYSSDLILVKHFFSPHDAGIYASLSTLGKIIFFGSGPISAVMFPLVSRKKARGENYRKIFLYSFFATICLSIGILLIYWLYPSLAIKLLFGSKYLEAQNLLVWFGVFMSLFAMSSLLVNYGLSLGKTFTVILPLIAAILQIILILLFHQTLYLVILVSIFSTSLLLVSLLIYFTLYGKQILPK